MSDENTDAAIVRDAKEEIAVALAKHGIIKFGRFPLANGKESSYYIDLRAVPSYPDLYEKAISAYASMASSVGKENFDAVVGVPVAGLVFAAPIAREFKAPLLFVRKEAKGHGQDKMVEGNMKQGMRCLLIDDIITDGGSKLELIKCVRDAGGIITDVIVLLDRLEGGRAGLAKEGVVLHALMDVNEMAVILSSKGMLTPEQHTAIWIQTGSSKHVRVP